MREQPGAPIGTVNAVLAEVSTMFGRLAQELAGKPVKLIKYELANAWRDRFATELTEPNLTAMARGIHTRQPWPIRWRTPTRPVPALAADNGPPPERSRRAMLDLAVTDRRDAHGLLRHSLAAWGLAGQQVAEDAQLLTGAMLANLGDHTPAGHWIRVELTLGGRLLTVALVSEHAERGSLPKDARRRYDQVRTQLNRLAYRWAREPYYPGVRIWCQLQVPA